MVVFISRQVTTPATIILFRYQKHDSPLNGVSLLWSITGVHNFGIDHVRLEHCVDDTLHTLVLGTYQKLAGLSLAQVLISNAFRVSGSGQEERYAKTMFILRHRLRLHYRLVRIKSPQHAQSRIRHLSLNQIGSLKAPNLAAKGGQTVDIVPFCTRLMDECSHLSEKFILLARAGRAIADFEVTMKPQPRVLSDSAQNRLLNACITHCVAYQMAGGCCVPKHHWWLHLAHGSGWGGNPKGYSTYGDESENGLVAKQGRFAHPFAFAFAVLRKQVAQERIDLS